MKENWIFGIVLVQLMESTSWYKIQPTVIAYILITNHSMILLVVLNANYEFNIVDVGEAGRQRDLRIVCWGKSYVK